MSEANIPRAFISYSWEDETHLHWVSELAVRLRKDGVDVMLDRWGVFPGDHLTKFMERSLRENDFILIICTPQYKKKSDERLGGVGYEGNLMSAEVLTKRNFRKFIPILKHSKWEEALPYWLYGAYFIDLSKPELFEHSYQELLDTLHQRRQQPPPIGRAPYKGENHINNSSTAEADSLKLNGLSSGQAVTSERVKSSQLLFSIEQRLKEPLDKLCYIDERTLVSISNIFDEHDRREHQEKKLRHVYYEFCNSISFALSPQIVWQTSAALHRRLRSLDDIERRKQYGTARWPVEFYNV